MKEVKKRATFKKFADWPATKKPREEFQLKNSDRGVSQEKLRGKRDVLSHVPKLTCK